MTKNIRNQKAAYQAWAKMNQVQIENLRRDIGNLHNEIAAKVSLLKALIQSADDAAKQQAKWLKSISK